MQGITLSVYRFQNTIADTILEEGHAMQQRGLVRMQWDLELSSVFMPAAYRPLMHDDAVFDWPIQHSLSDKPDAGGWAVASKLKSKYSVHIAHMTVERWLDEHRDALLAGTLERHMLDEDGRPENYTDLIATVLKAEPKAGRERVHPELKRIYRVVVPEQRLRTCLDSLDMYSLGTGATSSDSARRRAPKDRDEGCRRPIGKPKMTTETR